MRREVDAPDAVRGTVGHVERVRRKKHHVRGRTWGTDVLRCPCGGRRSIRCLHSTRAAAEARLLELGFALPSRILPPATAPPQLSLAV